MPEDLETPEDVLQKKLTLSGANEYVCKTTEHAWRTPADDGIPGSNHSLCQDGWISEQRKQKIAKCLTYWCAISEMGIQRVSIYSPWLNNFDAGNYDSWNDCWWDSLLLWSFPRYWGFHINRLWHIASGIIYVWSSIINIRTSDGLFIYIQQR